ncbi:tyrosine-type recombinase/integrase [Tunturiibacter lichenicola]|jgi:integrase/recombinase XerD|uniref:tyrosine-type recombinase/integrase n=1 Tax=Tunturiibacter lichenicola TaxID=2051959 RepID=UPI0021B295EF|nr:site-specific integrase [Edaphobacter lichenicola]
MWVEGTTNGTYLRRSMKTASWERATVLARVIEDSDNASKTPERKDEPVTIVKAVTEYLADAKARELADATLYKLETQLRKQFLGWCKAEGYKFLTEFDLRAAQSFRASWTDGGLAKKKKQERLTGFFWFCIRAGWLTANPTDRLGRISVTQAPTDYFTRGEYEKLLDATYLYREGRGETIGGINGTRIRALIMLMRWSGLRIRDAVTLEKTRLINDNLLLYQAKTGTPVYVPLPPQVAEALRTLPDGVKPNPRYFFWSGNGLPKSAVADWQRSFRRVFKLAGLEKPDGSAKRCFPHMLRDTFAVEMLLAGVPIDQVSMLLGHASVKITEKHYSPWVKARQDQLAASVRNAWGFLGGTSPLSPKRGKTKLVLIQA